MLLLLGNIDGLLPVLRLAAWLTILVVIFVPLEMLFAANSQKILRKGIVTDVGYYFLNNLLIATLLSTPIAALAWIMHRLLPSGVVVSMETLPIWARALLGLVAGEVGYYWGHRWSHEIPFLWRFHSVHHSAEHVDFLVNSRAHPVDMVFGRFCGLVPVYVLGLGGPTGAEGTAVPVVVTLIGAVWGFFIHANLRCRFGPLEWVVSTPGFHHWHHTLNQPINRNFASTLPWIDRLFGTHYLPRNEWPSAYGIEAKLPDSLAEQLAYPFRKQTPVPDEANTRLPCSIGPPG
jgi:sterol desaturase/sphingolipid hydroxylase (fatty acid hydroxylase superfamily)